MRILVIGESEVTTEISALFPDRRDFRMARFSTAEKAAEILDGSEPVLALLHVSDDDLSPLDDLAALAGRGARVLVLATSTSSLLRAASFDAGAADVVYPPLTPARVESAVLSLLGRPARRETRFVANVPAIVSVHLPGAQPFQGHVEDLSRGGCRVRSPGTFSAGGVVRIAIQPPPPHRLPTLFALLLACEEDDEPGWSIARARFVGLTDEEKRALADYVETLEPAPVDPAIALDALIALDDAALASADLGTVAGVRLPPLTASERAGISAKPGSAARPLASVALARARTTMIFELLATAQGLAQRARSRLDPATLRDEVRRAHDVVREALAREIAADNIAAIRDLKDLVARLTVAADRVERISEWLTGRSERVPAATELQEQGGVVSFRTDEPIPQEPVTAEWQRRRTRSKLAAVALAVLAVALGLSSLQRRSRRQVDPSISAIATKPVLVSGSVRVRTLFRSHDGRRVAVVDGSWFRIPFDQRESTLASLLHDAGEKSPPGHRFEVRDYRGHDLAVVGSDGRAFVYPAPFVRDAGGD